MSSRKMEKRFGELVACVGKNAKNLLGESKDITVHVFGQNDEGKIDLADVFVIAEFMGNARCLD